jgi:translation elongation factor P/translation initiation factor 5A
MFMDKEHYTKVRVPAHQANYSENLTESFMYVSFY